MRVFPKVTLTISTMFMLMFNSSPAISGSYEEAVAAENIKDYKSALSLFMHAADTDHMCAAMHKVGIYYYEGNGVPQNYNVAYHWLLRSAECGFPTSMNLVGVFLRDGRGVDKNIIEAHKWFNLAVAHGYLGAKAHRDNLASQMTPQEISQAQKLASEWKPKAE